jgi:hypothetical protein
MNSHTRRRSFALFTCLSTTGLMSLLVLYSSAYGGTGGASEPYFGALEAAGGTPVVLNEVMAANGAAVRDPQGEYDDWVELHNASDAPVNVGALYLTDDAKAPTRWRIPTNNPNATTIPAHGFLVVWTDGETADAGLHANFRLDTDGDALYLFDTDGKTLLDSVEFGGQTTDVSYGRYPDATGDWQFLLSPTPGAANTPAYLGAVSELTFSPGRGFYKEPVTVTISCATPDVVIYYSTDGSEPFQMGDRGPVGTVYTQPLRIAKTTCLRAVALKQGWVPSRTQTQTYLFLAHVAQQPAYPAGFPTTWKGVTADYGMASYILSNPQYGGQLEAALLSLPTMSLVLATKDLFDAQTGIYANSGSTGVAWERPGSIELIYPDGTEGFQVNCGVRMQGGAFRSPSACTKHSFRLLFKGAYGLSKLRYPLFGPDAVAEFDTIILRGAANDGYAWGGNEQNATYLRDQFMRDLQLATGNACGHGSFVHLYVNGLYWGLYNPCERPDAAFSSSYYGGEKEDWDAFKHKGFFVSNGDRTALNLMLAQCQQAGQSYAELMKLQGKNVDGTVNPAYPCLLDLSDYVDYMIVNYWGGNWDWPWNNYWLGRDRTAASTGFKFYCWDAEDVMLTSRSPLTWNSLTDPKAGQEVGQPHAQLKNNPEYRLFFADHVHRFFFNGGILTPDPLIRRYTELAAAVEKAIIPEAARWGDQHGSSVTPQNWITMRDKTLKTYLPQRTAIVLDQFRTAGLYPTVDAPVFYINGTYQHGGHVATSDSFSVKGTNGTIYYTLDGTDPRVPGTIAGAGTSTVLVAENAAKRVLVPTAASSDAWRTDPAFNDAAWLSGSGGVGYERSSGYETLFSINVQGPMYQRNATCYIRIPFTLTANTLQGLTSLVLKVRYDDAFVAYLNGVEVQRANFTGTPAWNSTATTSCQDSDAVNLQAFDISSRIADLHTGTNLLAIQALNDSTTSSDFLNSVELSGARTATGGTTPTGISPSALPYTSALTLSQSALAKARVLNGTTWSALNEAVFAVGPVAQSLRVSELMYHPPDTGNPDDPNTEFIELTNIGSQSINLNLVQFTKGIHYTFPSFDLAAGSYCLLAKDLMAFQAQYGTTLPVVGQYAGSLDNGGEHIEMVDAVGQVIQSFDYRDDWFKTTDGLGYSLTVKNPQLTDANSLNDAGAWQAALPSPGRARP